MKLDDHPTVKRYRLRTVNSSLESGAPLEAAFLKGLCLEAGADDAGFASMSNSPFEEEWGEIRSAFPSGKSLVSIVCRLNPVSIRSLSRSAADLEFLQGMKKADAAARRVAARLGERGVQAFTPSSGFPMDLEKWPQRMWPVSHKLAAEAAGMGMRGRSRLLLHPRFGAFVALGTLVLDTAVTGYGEPLGYNPCLECGLCAAVCPVGAVAADGAFGFTTCLTHNYHDRLGGFSRWVEELVASRDAFDYRRRVTDPETVSVWQALTCGVSNKCSYCVAVCPAGDDVIGPYLENRRTFREEVVKPLQGREETVYVMPDSDGEEHLARRFPHKTARRAGSGIRPDSVENFLTALPLAFNRNRAKGLSATYHLTFTGEEQIESTVVIREGTLLTERGHRGEPDLRLTADSRTWLRFLTGETGLLPSLLRRRIRIKGPPALMKKFAACFPL